MKGVGVKGEMRDEGRGVERDEKERKREREWKRENIPVFCINRAN